MQNALEIAYGGAQVIAWSRLHIDADQGPERDPRLRSAWLQTSRDRRALLARREVGQPTLDYRQFDATVDWSDISPKSGEGFRLAQIGS